MHWNNASIKSNVRSSCRRRSQIWSIRWPNSCTWPKAKSKCCWVAWKRWKPFGCSCQNSSAKTRTASNWRSALKYSRISAINSSRQWTRMSVAGYKRNRRWFGANIAKNKWRNGLDRVKPERRCPIPILAFFSIRHNLICAQVQRWPDVALARSTAMAAMRPCETTDFHQISRQLVV